MRLAVTGGRDYAQADVVDRVMTRVRDRYGGGLLVVNGVCGLDADRVDWWARSNMHLMKGLDRLVFDWCDNHGVAQSLHPAHWTTRGKAAGPERNMEMAQRADMLLSFPGGRGTANCTTTFALAGKPIVCVDRLGETRWWRADGSHVIGKAYDERTKQMRLREQEERDRKKSEA